MAIYYSIIYILKLILCVLFFIFNILPQNEHILIVKNVFMFTLVLLSHFQEMTSWLDYMTLGTCSSTTAPLPRIKTYKCQLV